MPAIETGMDGFAVIQSVGIIGSLLFSAIALRRDAKERKITNMLTMTKNHRELWGNLSQRHDLERILRTDVNVLAAAPTVAESEFLNLAIVHFQTGWSIANAGGIITPKELAGDVRGFFTLPLPRAIWEKTKQFRNQRFVGFVEKALGN